MTNWKSKYLEMKLKYINAKQKGGTLPNGEIHPAMRITIDKLAVDIRNNHNTSKMSEILQIMNINSIFKNYVINYHNDIYCLILFQFVKELITVNFTLIVPPAFADRNGRANLNIIIPHLVRTSTVFTPTEILEVILLTLHDVRMWGEGNLINLAAQIANLINIHKATINPDFIRSDNNIDADISVERRAFIYAELHYIHNIPIYKYFVDEKIANMPTTPLLSNTGNVITDIVNKPAREYYIAYANANQAYADAVIQYYMQIRRLQLNIIYSINLVGKKVPLNTTELIILRNRIKDLDNNYVNHYNP